MRPFPLVILLMIIVSTVPAQNRSDNAKPCKVSGKVTDSVSGKPIEYATVTLFMQGSPKPVAGMSTDTKGHFTIDSLLPGNYRLVIEFIGYKAKIRSLKLATPQSNLSLGNIPLAGQVQTLAEVTVIGQKKVIENTIDKLVYNAERDITAQTGTATDLLQKVPQVSVDVDGNVELAGSGNVLFLINGKPSLFGTFNSHHHEAQGFYPAFISYSLAFRKLFWNKKGSIALTANNFFSKYVDQRTDLYGPGFLSSNLRRVPYRSIGLNVTWKFGRLVIRKEKSDDNPIDLNAPPQ